MKRIGILGAGNVGAALAAGLVRLGYDVNIANSRGADSLRSVEMRTGAKGVEARQAVAGADIVVVAIPMGGFPSLDAAVAEEMRPGTIVIDAGNYYPARDGHIEAIDRGLPESVWVSQQFRSAITVKAFNNVIASCIASKGLPGGSKRRIALPVASDDAQARDVVKRLVDELGFDAVDAGPLEGSWRQQPGQPAYCTEPDRDQLRLLLGRAVREKGAVNRDSAQKLMASLPADFSPETLVQVARLSAGLDVWRFASWRATSKLIVSVASTRLKRLGDDRRA